MQENCHSPPSAYVVISVWSIPKPERLPAAHLGVATAFLYVWMNTLDQPAALLLDMYGKELSHHPPGKMQQLRRWPRQCVVSVRLFDWETPFRPCHAARALAPATDPPLARGLPFYRYVVDIANVWLLQVSLVQDAPLARLQAWGPAGFLAPAQQKPENRVPARSVCFSSCLGRELSQSRPTSRPFAAFPMGCPAVDCSCASLCAAGSSRS
jgi:hypothetical protein